MSTSTQQAQAYWKKIKVPAALTRAGWKLIREDSTAPFRLANEKLGMSTGGFPNPEEAIEMAAAMQTESDEAAAVQAEGNGATTPAPDVLPVELVDEGWRLHCDRVRWPATPFVATFGTPPPAGAYSDGDFRQTANYETAGAAITEAVMQEQLRQTELEARERGEVRKTEPLSGPKNQTSETPAEVMLALDQIRLDGGTQQRVTVDQETIDRYRQAMRAGSVFPPVKVFFDSTDYWLADGFYRYYARQQLGQVSIPAEVVPGTQRAAVLYSVGANETHGLPRSNADKRHAVTVMLNDPEWAMWSNGYIAEHARVSAAFVGNIRKELNPDQKHVVRKTRSGRVIDTSKIGAREEPDDRQLTIESAGEVETTDHGEGVITDREVVRCSQCGNEILERKMDGGSVEGFQDAKGRCWDCSERITQPGEVNRKRKTATQASAQLTKGRDLSITLAWSRKKPARVLVLIGDGTRANTITQHELIISAVPTLPPAVLELVAADIAAAEKVKAPARKPAKKTTAPPPMLKRKPAKKTTSKATGITTSKRIPKTTTRKPGAKRNGRSTTSGRGAGRGKRSGPAKRRGR